MRAAKNQLEVRRAVLGVTARFWAAQILFSNPRTPETALQIMGAALHLPEDHHLRWCCADVADQPVGEPSPRCVHVCIHVCVHVCVHVRVSVVSVLSVSVSPRSCGHGTEV